jgi:DNA-binding cell septation regulator SpoVG
MERETGERGEEMNGMKITDIIIYPAPKKKGSNLMAHAKIVFNESLLINGIRILKGVEDKLFICFPKEVAKDGCEKAWDICYPITAELRTYVSEMVIGRYEALKETVCSECGRPK